MSVLGDLRDDLLHALRMWRRRPGFTLLAAVTLALGVGVTTTVFSLADWLVLRPVPGIRDPSRLALVELANDQHGDSYSPAPVSYPDFRDLQGATPAFQALAGWSPTPPLQIATPGATPRKVPGAIVVGDYFGTLGVRPEVGRFFTPAELRPGGNGRLAVISHRLWATLFGGSSSALGAQLQVDGIAFSVIGVAPPAFRGPGRLGFGAADLWLPAPAFKLIDPLATRRLDDRSTGLFWPLVGRLRRGATPALAQQQVRAAMKHLVHLYPRANALYSTATAEVYGDLWVRPDVRARTERTVGLLLGISLLVMLVACANVANLLLFRGVHRRGEMAVRRALGASTGRVVRQHLGEGLALALFATAGGLILAVWLDLLLQGHRFARWLPVIGKLPMDARVLGFGLAAAISTAILASLVPTSLAPGKRMLHDLHEAAPTDSAGHARLRSAFTVVQVAAATVLLVAALLLTGTVRALSRVRLGFDADSVTAYELDARPQGYTAAQASALHRQFAERVAELHGVERVALASNTPFPGSSFMGAFTTSPGEGHPTPLNVFYVSGSYFRTLGIPLEEGRSLRAPGGGAGSTVTDSAAEPVVLSRGAAHRLFGTVDPMGRTIIEHGYGTHVALTVVGVSADIHTRTPGDAPTPIVYEPLGRAPRFLADNAVLVVRSAVPPARLDTKVRGIARALAPDAPLEGHGLLSQSARESVAQQRLLAEIATLLALLGAPLAGVGLYGVVAYSVARRRHEIGIRMALGADRADLVGLVVRQVAALLVLGLVIGWGGGAALSRVLHSRLFGLSPLDPRVYLAAGVVFALIALAAAALPARRATRVSPLASMRAE